MEEKEEGDQTRAGSKDLLAAQMGAVGRGTSAGRRDNRHTKQRRGKTDLVVKTQERTDLV
jgi:hypothetical protein